MYIYIYIHTYAILSFYMHVCNISLSLSIYIYIYIHLIACLLFLSYTMIAYDKCLNVNVLCNMFILLLLIYYIRRGSRRKRNTKINCLKKDASSSTPWSRSSPRRHLRRGREGATDTRRAATKRRRWIFLARRLIS